MVRMWFVSVGGNVGSSGQIDEDGYSFDIVHR